MNLFAIRGNDRASSRDYECVFLPIPLASDYAITATVRLVPPYDVRSMNDEFQEAKLLSERDGVGTFRITYHPFHRQIVTANPGWRREDATMTEFLKSRPAANWDADLRARILKELKAAEIDPERLDDKTFVERVSAWAMRRSTFNPQFGLWMVAFQNGKPTVPESLKPAFAENEPKDKALGWIFDREVYGKGMVDNRTHGACTSSSTYLATILRAVGIPTRIVVTVPLFDANDPRQTAMVEKSITHHETARTILRGNQDAGFSNHLFNEAWVGRKWVRLNYDRLGQGILDPNYEGLMTHVLTANDVSEIPFATTWGTRYGVGAGPKLSSVNPYQLVALEDHLPAGLDNPPVALQPKLITSTIVAVLPKGDPKIPGHHDLGSGTDALLSVREWLGGEDHHQMRDFESLAGRSFTLRAAGHPDVAVELSGLKISMGDGSFQAYGVHLKGRPDPGVAYALLPDNAGHVHTWSVTNDARWVGKP